MRKQPFAVVAPGPHPIDFWTGVCCESFRLACDAEVVQVAEYLVPYNLVIPKCEGQ